MIPAIIDYHEAGFRVFALHSIEQGRCACGDPDCEAIGKHPAISAWQTVPHWSDEQLDVLMRYQVETGFGVCIDDHLVIDVDPRNGGTDSLERLKNDVGIDFEAHAGFVVRTGGAGLHIYYMRPPGAFLQHLPDYPGIDFKTSGFVVGSGSLHLSGNEYEAIKGFPQDLADAPAALLALLARPERTRTIISGRTVDVTADEVSEVVSAIPNDDVHYDDWVRVGMGIHHATGGAGFDLWLQWSAKSAKHHPDQMDKKWHSFGKSANPVTLGTLLHMAEAAGYVRPVTFAVSDRARVETKPGEMPFDTRSYDIKRPPGFVGKIVKWMAGNSYSEPLEHLNVASALVAVGNAVGLHTTDDMTRVSTNLMVLCVAESASGKEAVISSYTALMKAAGISGTIAGGIKSKQEIVRNLIEHQAANLLQDELGEVLRTIENAKKRGGAAYLEGITGELMSIFTKANSSYHVSGDVRRDLLAALGKDLAQCNKLIDENADPTGRFARRAESIMHAMDAVAFDGLFRPYLSLIGYSVPGSLECIMSEEMAKNGFLSRALLVIEERDNPRPIIGATGPTAVPDDIANTLKMLSTGGSFDADGPHRIEYLGEKRAVRTEPHARDLLNRLREWEWEYAEHHRESTGYTPLIRRSFELISKISTILAAPEGIRTTEHVEWAACYVKHDLDRKIRHIQSVQAQEATEGGVVQDGIEARIINLCQRAGGEKESVIINRCLRRKGITRDQVCMLLEDMVRRGLLVRTTHKARNGASCAKFASVL